MYLNFYNLKQKPFQINTDPRFLWLGETHKEALAMLKYGVMDNRGFIMLTGNVGTGKTTLVNALINQLGPDVVVANVTDPSLDQLDFLNYLAYVFELNGTFSTKGKFLIAFREFLEKCFRKGKQVLLIVDEAQHINPKMFEEIRLLSNIEHQDKKLLNIFLVGQDELNSILDKHENRALRQRITLQYHLTPLSAPDVYDMVKHRLKMAGAQRGIFTARAVREIYSFSKGHPRLVNIICDQALITGYAANQKIIDASQIRECAEDLNLPKIGHKLPPPAAPVPEKKRADTILPPAGKKSYRLLWVFPVILLFLLISIIFLYFPVRDGIPLSKIAAYWHDQAGRFDLALNRKEKKISVPVNASKETLEKGSEESVKPASESSAPDILNTTETMESPAAVETMESPVAAGETVLWQDITAEKQEQIARSEEHYTLTFEFGSNDISKEGYSRLDHTADLMERYPEAVLMITGHTDNIGSDAYNVMLSKFRADIAKNYLIAKGVGPDRITAIGKGSEAPLTDNIDVHGRMANRRIEVDLSFK